MRRPEPATNLKAGLQQSDSTHSLRRTVEKPSEVKDSVTQLGPQVANPPLSALSRNRPGIAPSTLTSPTAEASPAPLALLMQCHVPLETTIEVGLNHIMELALLLPGGLGTLVHCIVPRKVPSNSASPLVGPTSQIRVWRWYGASRRLRYDAAFPRLRGLVVPT
ncbi:hypothetical protein NMY22_g11319 [Coprinellus aureogranulatus]|nr:hypothetical protein NMY22_g11319 [Coprinellus aureogranulatus]